jgi:hypothetical protein
MADSAERKESLLSIVTPRVLPAESVSPFKLTRAFKRNAVYRDVSLILRRVNEMSTYLSYVR